MRQFWSIIGAAIALIFIVISATPTEAKVGLTTDDAKYAAIVIDADSGEVLFSRRADSQRYPASITKIMTLYLTFEALSQGKLKLTDMITVSAHAARQDPSKLGLYPGEQISVDDAMRAVAVWSANDMAVALAEKIAGSESKFAALMTLRAQELGMHSTRFVNANGLPDSRQLSSPRDIAILSRAALRDYPQFYSYFSIHQFSFRGRSQNNHNHLLFRMPDVDGLKTGYTNASGFNLAASAKRGDHRLIVVVMGGRSSELRNTNVQWLINTGFDVLARRAAGEPIKVAQLYFEQKLRDVPAALLAQAQSSDSEDENEDEDESVAEGAQTPAAHPETASGIPAADASPPHAAGATAATADAAKTQDPRPALQTVTTANLPSVAATAATSSAAPVLADSQATTQIQTPASAAQASSVTQVAMSDAPPPVKTMAPIPDPTPPPAPAIETPQKVKAPAKPQRAPDANWLVQVGAFQQQSVARQWLKEIGHRFAEQFRSTDGEVTPAQGKFRARYEGFTHNAAENTCKVLTAKRVPCLVIRPG